MLERRCACCVTALVFVCVSCAASPMARPLYVWLCLHELCVALSLGTTWPATAALLTPLRCVAIGWVSLTVIVMRRC